MSNNIARFIIFIQNIHQSLKYKHFQQGQINDIKSVSYPKIFENAMYKN